MTASVRFDEALARAVEWVQAHRCAHGREALLLRDLSGHLRVPVSYTHLTLPTNREV